MNRLIVQLCVASCLLGVALSSGCGAVGFLGAIEQERRRTAKVMVEAEYRGLEGESVAVIVDAQRDIYMTSPEIVGAILTEVVARLEENEAAERIISPQQVQTVLYDEPDLLDRTFDEIAARFGVTRLVIIQLEEFRLSEFGNEYVWNGHAAGNLMVVEADSYLEDDVRLDRYVSVRYPTQPNVTVDEIPAQAVALELLRRFANRTSWFFYDHLERHEDFREY